MYAIIRDRGRQYRVVEGETLQLDLLPQAQDGQSIEFNEVLLTSNGEGDVKVGRPTVPGASVSASVVAAEFKGPKIDVVHFRRRKDSMTKKGHRQRFTKVKIDKIQVG
ncbi:MAG: 50S ribosomal protein L21 [Planctomycetota bacterium]|nr:MAG: 50S ribosomal protein L21 [Planctomycetota bacterium]